MEEGSPLNYPIVVWLPWKRNDLQFYYFSPDCHGCTSTPLVSTEKNQNLSKLSTYSGQNFSNPWFINSLTGYSNCVMVLSFSYTVRKQNLILYCLLSTLFSWGKNMIGRESSDSALDKNSTSFGIDGIPIVNHNVAPCRHRNVAPHKLKWEANTKNNLVMMPTVM